MCFQFLEPLPEPVRPMSELDRLVDDLLGFASSWAEARFYGGDWTVDEARRVVRHEIEKLNAIYRMREDGL